VQVCASDCKLFWDSFFSGHSVYIGRVMRLALLYRLSIPVDPCENKDARCKNQSNLAKGEIAVASPPNCSFVFARWQLRTDGLALWLGLDTPNLTFPSGSRIKHNVSLDPTSVPAKWRKPNYKSVKQFKQGGQTTDDKQTDRRTTLRRNE